MHVFDHDVFGFALRDERSELVQGLREIRAAIAVHQALHDVPQGLALTERAVDRLAHRDRAHEALQELAVATDDVDFGVAHGLSQNLRLRRDHFSARTDLLQLDALFLVQAQSELFVTAARRVEQLHRLGFLRQARRLGDQLFARDLGLDHALLLDRRRVRLADSHLGQALGGRLGLDAFGDPDLGARRFVCRVELGIGEQDAFTRLELSSFLAGFCRLHLLDQDLLSRSFGSDAHGLLLARGLRGIAQILDLLFFRGHVLFDRDAIANHVRNFFLLNFDFFVARDTN